MSITIRQKIERETVSNFVQSALAKGYRLAVSLKLGFDTDDMLLGSRDRAKIVNAVFDGDDAHIFVQPAEGPTITDGKVVTEGWVHVVLGNDGWNCINEYTPNLEPLMHGTVRFSDKYSN